MENDNKERLSSYRIIQSENIFLIKTTDNFKLQNNL